MQKKVFTKHLNNEKKLGEVRLILLYLFVAYLLLSLLFGAPRTVYPTEAILHLQ
jgi:hypothetical protein